MSARRRRPSVLHADQRTAPGESGQSGRGVLARALRRRVLGEAGAAPALVLAGVALVIALTVTGGPRALVSADNQATRQAIAQAPALDVGVSVTADLQAGPGAGVPTAASIHALIAKFAGIMPESVDFAGGGRWAGITTPTVFVTNAARSAAADNPPTLELDYRDGLAGHCALLAGALPTGPSAAQMRSGRPPIVTLPIAVAQTTAKRFSLRVGSLIDLSAASPGLQPFRLRVTGILRPDSLTSSFWQVDPVLNQPELQGSQSPHWFGAVFVGPGDLAAVGNAFVGETERAQWFFPFGGHLTAPDVPRLEAALAALAVSPAPRAAEVKLGVTALQHTAVSTGLADGLASFNAQWHGIAGADSLLIAGLFAAGVILLLICASLAAQAYQPELALLRVRGGSLTQLTGRMLVRSCCLTLPGLASGLVVAIAVLPDSAGLTSWVLAAAVAVTAVAGLPVICVLHHRRPRSAEAGSRASQVVARPTLRRLVGELTVLAVAGAAIADVRIRGAGSGSTVPYLSASAVLVAAGVGLLVNRAYRGPLRALTAAASTRRGPVGFVGLARAAGSRAGSALPALALMLTITLAAFASMVMTSISAGQQAASWAQVGADFLVAGPGNASVTAADLRAFAQVPGVRHAAAVYTAQSQGPLAVQLTGRRATSQPLGLAVVDPASYGALSADTPWSGFPARALSEPAAGSAAAVPILVTPGVAARNWIEPRLRFGGLALPVRIIGTVTDTAAMPSGGSYVLLPSWAAGRLPSIPPPSTVLVTGPAVDVRALRAATAELLPGSQITLRQQVLSQLAATPALRLSDRLYLVGALAAALLSVLAVLFALASSARSRAMLMTRLAALGMASRQALLVRLTDAIPLLWVATIGTVASSLLLAEVVGPVLGLNVFAGSAVPVPLRPTWPALTIPLAGVAVLAVALLAIDGMRSRRHELGAALRQEEAG